MTVNDTYALIKHYFNLDDSLKYSITSWIKMFSRPMGQTDRDIAGQEFLSWLESALLITISDFNKSRVITALNSCVVYNDGVIKNDKPLAIQSITIARSQKELESDPKHMDEVAEEVCSSIGVTVEDLKSDSRKTEVVRAKKMFIKESLTRYRYSDKTVGDFLGVDRTTVIYHRNDGVYKAKKRRYQSMRAK